LFDYRKSSARPYPTDKNTVIQTTVSTITIKYKNQHSNNSYGNTLTINVNHKIKADRMQIFTSINSNEKANVSIAKSWDDVKESEYGNDGTFLNIIKSSTLNTVLNDFEKKGGQIIIDNDY